MSEQQQQDLTPTLQELMAQMARMQAELDSLKSRASLLPQPVQKEKPEVSTTRRKLLRQLAGGLVAGLAVAGIGVTSPNEAEAKLSSNPSGNNLTGRVGMLVMPPGGTVSGTMGGVAGTKVGILVSGDTSFNLTNNQLVPTVNSAIIGYTSGGGTAIAGLSQTGIGIYGQADANFGVRGASTSSHGVYGSTSNTSQTPASGVLGTATGSINSGVHGVNDTGAGVYGESTNGNGVYGQSINNHGVFGVSTNTTLNKDWAGVYGAAFGIGNHGVKGASNEGNGVYGETVSGNGVKGYSTTGLGVLGATTSGHGVHGQATTGYGVYGYSGQTGYAGYFDGSVNVTSNFTAYQVGAENIFATHVTKSGGSFKIDHPLDPANKYLYHSFVESPDMMNIYNVITTLDHQGEAIVVMPDWFEALNFDFRYQLTCLGQYSQVYIAEEMKERKFKIAGGKPGQKISWQVTGIRQDEWAKAHRIPVEEDKNEKEKGKYLHPELFGQPEEMSVRPRPVAAK